ncbi:MAG: glycoside hydrolase family 3 protein, partial [Spirochaetaceae bacterium]|nr:glycoside hydrolase family 3 protein [Spirochaetaceae bacterium]
VIADDFAMGAVSGGRSVEENAVAALRAGVDMVMAWPATVTKIHRAILRALVSGALPRARLEESAARILKAKSLLK